MDDLDQGNDGRGGANVGLRGSTRARERWSVSCANGCCTATDAALWMGKLICERERGRKRFRVTQPKRSQSLPAQLRASDVALETHAGDDAVVARYGRARSVVGALRHQGQTVRQDGLADWSGRSSPEEETGADLALGGAPGP